MGVPRPRAVDRSKEVAMPLFLFRARYTAAGAAGVLKEGGSGRAAAIEKMIGSVGGKVVAQYWAMGEDDYFLIADLPDVESAAAGSLTVGASGAASVTTAQLLSASDVDKIAKRRAEYRPPGA
jgi:uncharacterized protein with GYD domain